MSLPHEDGPFKAGCADARAGLAEFEKDLRLIVQLASRRRLDASRPEDNYNAHEAVQQAELAVRAIEDARMRVGKVIQYALQDGITWGGKEPA